MAVEIKKHPNGGDELGVEYDPDNFKVTVDTVKLPEWAKEPNLRDKNGRSSYEEDYDPTTLYIPPKALDKMGTLMRKYWEVKSQHFDKLVFIRHLKVYFVYNKDAFIMHTEYGSRLFAQFGNCMVYLHPPNINTYCQRLLEKNYKIVLVEPTQEYQDKDDAKQEIYQIITKGTFIEPDSKHLTSRYCLFLVQKNMNWGFAYIDTTTHEIYMGEFQDAHNKGQLRSLLIRVAPVEIVLLQQSSQ